MVGEGKYLATYRRCKSPLEKPVTEGEIIAGASERSVANETTGVSTVSEAVSEKPPKNGTDSDVENVLQQNILSVLAAHCSDLKHGKASLHEKHKET